MNIQSLFQILVNPKGSVNYIEYRVGIIALFMILGVHVQYFLLTGPVMSTFVFQFFYLDLSGGHDDALILVNLITLPAVLFVPSAFLLAWGCIVLMYKRFGALGYSKLWGGMLGFLMYLGLASLERSPYFYASYFNYKEASKNLIIFTAVVFSILMLLSLALIVFGWVRRSKKEPMIDYGAHTTPMNIYAYVMKMGQWMLLSAVVLSLIPTLGYAYIVYEKIYISRPIRWVILVCYSAVCLTFLYYYLRYAYFRLKDAGYSVWLWLVAVPLMYCVILSVCASLFYFFDSLGIRLVTIGITLFLTSLMLAYPLLLLILPSQTLSQAPKQEKYNQDNAI